MEIRRGYILPVHCFLQFIVCRKIPKEQGLYHTFVDAQEL